MNAIVSSMPNTLWGNQPDELDSYLTSNTVLDDYNKINNEHGVEFDLLKFWKVQHDTFPKLAMLAQFIFPIPASSVASESNFSKSGRTVNDRRTQLDADTVNSLMFLHSNLK